MTCLRCGGLLVYDYWQTDDLMSGIDWRCVLCSARWPITWRQEYDPLRTMAQKKKGRPDPDEDFVLTRKGELIERKAFRR